MKILLFEYITGGGFNKQALPNSLAAEGSLMLNALLDDLIRLNRAGLICLDLTVMRDWRLDDLDRAFVNTVIIRPEHDITEEFARLVKKADLVWPIAPEFDNILQNLCRIVESLSKTLLTSPATAVAVAGNKLKTYQLLELNHISTVPSRMFDSNYPPDFDKLRTGGEWMVKAVDGAGCADSYVIANSQDFERMAARQGRYIIQPHLQGAKTSLSCLFKQGSGWLLCANLQRFDFIGKQYRLSDVVVNHHPDRGPYRQLVAKIARALPELWGYAGIDLIESAEQTWVLEINPRLTTSFVGIYKALGVNVAEAVLQLMHGDPVLKPMHSRAVTIQAKQEIDAN